MEVSFLHILYEFHKKQIKYNETYIKLFREMVYSQCILAFRKI